jgi:HTH-type transcriptional regulator/antitoxin HipB
MRKSKLKTFTLEQVKDKIFGKIGTPERDLYELEFKMSMIGNTIKKVRTARNLTQSQLGMLVGVQKAQISKLENGTNSASIDTVYRVFNALKAEINFSIKLKNYPLHRKPLARI